MLRLPAAFLLLVVSFVGCSRGIPPGTEGQPARPESTRAKPEPTKAESPSTKIPPEPAVKADSADKGKQPPKATAGEPKEDPVVNGKKLSEWIADMRGGDEFDCLDAIAAFRKFGPRAAVAVPVLIGGLGNDNLFVLKGCATS